jgi:hypothetical protein
VVLPTPKRTREQHDVGEEADDTSKKARFSADSQVQEPPVTVVSAFLSFLPSITTIPQLQGKMYLTWVLI